ncbi:uncharacterized protein LOC133320747 [Danaus plexippus]|uniref:uncharacterized protein LOC133320747 n=1 Tax=Danaus plexippus TaxID=13037 RepID=UPI002AB119DA|nr:uncharacterized protein LOC133320747 [Danaus plexippus]
MQAGTTCDVFVKENLEWLAAATGWSKFLLAASAGVLQKGHLSASQQVLAAYLPGSGSGPYAEGGGLYGLGLIRANQFDFETKNYLLSQLTAAPNYSQNNFDPYQHGACLGLGLMAMGTNDPALKNILFGQSSIAGEAAALAMGLVSLESNSEEVFLELYNHAQETPHDRIIRQSSLGAALVLFKNELKAEPYIDMLVNNMEPMIRYGGMFAIGLAYCGTNNTNAVKRLLHFSVLDVCMDVRRAAVIALGFIVCDPVKAVNMLLPLAQDSVDFVRQAGSLAFRPTAVIGLTCDLLAPLDFKIRCDISPEKIAYTEPFDQSKKSDKKEATVAVRFYTQTT